MTRNIALGAGVTIGLTVATFIIAAHRVTAQTNGAPEHLTAAAIDPNRPSTSSVDIQIDRWTSDAQRDKLQSVLLDKGPDQLLDALQSAPKVGTIKRPGSLSWDLHYARRVPLPDGGERVVIATDRPVSFWEAANQARTVDYPFTVIELRLNKEGEGEGKMSVATKITADRENKLITLENWDLQPVMLKSVRRERSSH